MIWSPFFILHISPSVNLGFKILYLTKHASRRQEQSFYESLINNFLLKNFLREYLMLLKEYGILLYDYDVGYFVVIFLVVAD